MKIRIILTFLFICIGLSLENYYAQIHEGDLSNTFNKEIFEENYDCAPSTSNTYVGTYRITFYCSACNTPPGTTQTSTGRYVPGYSVASSDFSPGTILIINGEEYRVDDCGCAHGVVDRLVDGSNGCNCNTYGTYTADVYIKGES